METRAQIQQPADPLINSLRIPLSGRPTPPMRRNKVDLPDPFGPTNPTTRPGATLKLISRSAQKRSAGCNRRSPLTKRLV